ncbi:MAG: rubrerythrin [Phycisphaeraceae bacterium]|nr:MAG: rubrerythrin [Phycisphaeraceae bacterium]
MQTDQRIIDALIRCYNAEIETVMNYLANSVNLDGVRAKHIKTALADDVQEELTHAQTLAKRIKTIGGVVPGSHGLEWTQKMMQPPKDTTDTVSVIKGVIAAEEAAIAGYEEVIKLCEGTDYATQDMAITLLADEQEHRREFIGFLKEYEQSP